jgi:lipid-A-disaccharide synthase
LIRLAQSLRIPVVYYIAPQLWAWGEKRVAALHNRIKRLLLILPFEERFFRRHGVDCVFVGHPLMDALGDVESRSYKPIVPGTATIGLLPGSRRSELSYMLPHMLDAARRVRSVHERTTFVLPLAETVQEGAVSGFGIPSWVEVVRDRDWSHRLRMDLAWTSSGTATVENAILGVPMVIIYRTGWLNAMVARRLVRTPYVGLANLVAGCGVCPEFIQEQVRGDNLAAWTLDFFEDEDRQRLMLEGLQRARKALGEQGASRRAASEVLRVADGED